MMSENTASHRIPEDLDQRILTRNIGNSQLIIAGEFEMALSDIIEQLEHPPMAGKDVVTVADLVRRIAKSLRQGFAGLNPNGFDFCTWLWEVAPLHQIQIPEDAETSDALYGFCHLRTLAAITVEEYAQHQPEVCDSLVELLDASVNWQDAKTLITCSVLNHYLQHFDEEYPRLQEYAASTSLSRRVAPLIVAAKIVERDPSTRARAMELIETASDGENNAIVHSALEYARKRVKDS